MNHLRISVPIIKVCGVTQLDDLEWLAETGVDSIGINLVPSSKRFIALDRVAALSKRAKDLGLKITAVTMNQTADAMKEVLATAEWDFLQLHGRERPADIHQILEKNDRSGMVIIKALSWSGRTEEAELAKEWDEWAVSNDREGDGTPNYADRPLRLGCFLIDAFAPIEGGGTGRKVEWNLLHPRPVSLGQRPILLAGGLTPSNVRLAILRTKCDGVDVASGVESSPGCKSRELVAAFVAQARSGFDESAIHPLH